MVWKLELGFRNLGKELRLEKISDDSDEAAAIEAVVQALQNLLRSLNFIFSINKRFTG